ncbi:unnamed protein product [Cochlearia groenlandica]
MSERPNRHQRRPSQSISPISLQDLADISMITTNPPTSSVSSQPPRKQIPPPSPATPPTNLINYDQHASKDHNGKASSN